MALTRVDLQNLAERRIADAKALLDAGRYDAAYYLAGYAVECGLKACIANLLKAEVFPEKGFASAVYIHDLEKLIVLAGLKDRFDTDAGADPTLFVHWGIVSGWKEDTRYQNKDEVAARELYKAITDTPSGVLPWIKRYW
jgi:hypothetical protein